MNRSEKLKRIKVTHADKQCIIADCHSPAVYATDLVPVHVDELEFTEEPCVCEKHHSRLKNGEALVVATRGPHYAALVVDAKFDEPLNTIVASTIWCNIIRGVYPRDPNTSRARIVVPNGPLNRLRER